jgi:O-methyltransferase
MCEFLKTAPAGCVVEVGVFEGASLYIMASAQPDRQFYGYDTFAGMPPANQHDNTHKEGDFMTTPDVAGEYLKSLTNVKLIQGIYPHSDNIRPGCIALAHVDVDLYQSTYESLCHLAPMMVKGGRLYCDDSFVNTCEGATLALCRFCGERNIVPHVSHFSHNIPMTYLQF